jgi:tRNA(Ile)-lysidine synthase
MMNNYSFEKRISQILDIPSGSSVLVAVSGGVDSMSMLNALCSINHDLKIYVAHVNFNLRGNDSNLDEQLVAQWCSNRNLQLFIKSVDTLKYCKERGVSMEMGARELRYTWFESLIREHNIDYLFTAHNANDNAETIFINLLRGSGIKGLCGIGERVRMNGYTIVRPILAYAREEIEKYARYHNVPFRVDKTNLECDVVRNKIRNLVFPVLEKINPSAVHSINRSIKYVNSANTIISNLVDKEKDKLCIDRNRYMQKLYNVGAALTNIIPECTIEVSKLEQGNEEFWLYSIMSAYGFGGDTVEALYKTLHETAVKRFKSENYTAIKERGYIKIYSNTDLATPNEVKIDSLGRSGVYHFGKVEVKVEFLSADEYSKIGKGPAQLAAEGIMVLSLAKLEGNLSVRGMKKGDFFIPYGMKGSKKISDYFTDLKVDNATREFIPLLCLNNKVVSVIGNRIDANYAVHKEEPILLVSISNN